MILRPYTPPWALTHEKTAFMAGAISSYPGAAGPVSGTVAPMVMLLEVTPGVDAALADVEMTVVASVTPMAIAAEARTHRDVNLSFECLIAAPLLMMCFID